MTDAIVHGVAAEVLGTGTPAAVVHGVGVEALGTAGNASGVVHGVGVEALGTATPAGVVHAVLVEALGTLPPGVPNSLTATTPHQQMIRVSWVWPTIGFGTSYEVRVNGGSPLNVGLVTSYDLTGLRPGTSYLIEVRTVRGIDTSAWASVTKTTLKILVPFSASGTWTPPFGVTTVDLLLVAGGGSGGSGQSTGTGGGGGAGGVQWLTEVPVVPEVGTTVTVGAGGVGPAPGLTVGQDGASSEFVTPLGTQTCVGGGGGGLGTGGDQSVAAGRPGGSGGGGGSGSGGINPFGGTGTAGQGSNGGLGFGSDTTAGRASGGGGGAGAVGGKATGGSNPGNGGDGRDMAAYVGIDYGASGWFGGGGGGGQGGTSTLGVGGRGGGGDGAGAHPFSAGLANTGGGGGGGRWNDTGGLSGGSGFVVVAYLISPPGNPASVAGIATEDTATLTWETPTTGGPVASYEVRIDSGTPIDVGLALTHTFPGLAGETTYALGVRAVSPEGNSAWIEAYPTTTNIPGKPRNVAVMALGTATRLTWEPPVEGGNVNHYEVSLDGGAPVDVGLDLSHEFPGLSPETRYEHEVKAVGLGGESPWVMVALTLPQTDFTFVWNPSTDDHGIASYDVALDEVIIGQTDADTLWYHVQNLTPGNTYSMTVRAMDIDGLFSAWSVPLVVTMQGGEAVPEVPGETGPGWEPNYFLTLGDEDSSQALEADLCVLDSGLVVAASVSTDFYAIQMRATDPGTGTRGPRAYFNNDSDGVATIPVDPQGMAVDDLSFVIAMGAYRFAMIGNATDSYRADGSPDPAGGYLHVASWFDVHPETLEITRVGFSVAPEADYYSDEVTAARWGEKLVILPETILISPNPDQIAVVDSTTFAVTLIQGHPNAPGQGRNGPVAVSGDYLFYAVQGGALATVNLVSGTAANTITTDLGANGEWAMHACTLSDGRIALICPGAHPAFTNDPLKLAIIHIDSVTGAIDVQAVHDLVPSADNVGWTGGWYSNVRSVSAMPDDTLVIGYTRRAVTHAFHWITVNPNSGAIIESGIVPGVYLKNTYRYTHQIAAIDQNEWAAMWLGAPDNDSDWGLYMSLHTNDAYGPTSGWNDLDLSKAHFQMTSGSSTFLPIDHIETADDDDVAGAAAALSDFGMTDTYVRLSSAGDAEWWTYFDGAQFTAIGDSAAPYLNLQFCYDVISRGASPVQMKIRLQDSLDMNTYVEWTKVISDASTYDQIFIDDDFFINTPAGHSFLVEGGDETARGLMIALGANPIIYVTCVAGLPYEVNLWQLNLLPSIYNAPMGQFEDGKIIGAGDGNGVVFDHPDFVLGTDFTRYDYIEVEVIYDATTGDTYTELDLGDTTDWNGSTYYVGDFSAVGEELTVRVRTGPGVWDWDDAPLNANGAFFWMEEESVITGVRWRITQSIPPPKVPQSLTLAPVRLELVSFDGTQTGITVPTLSSIAGGDTALQNDDGDTSYISLSNDSPAHQSGYVKATFETLDLPVGATVTGYRTGWVSKNMSAVNMRLIASAYNPVPPGTDFTNMIFPQPLFHLLTNTAYQQGVFPFDAYGTDWQPPGTDLDHFTEADPYTFISVGGRTTEPAAFLRLTKFWIEVQYTMP